MACRPNPTRRKGVTKRACECCLPVPERAGAGREMVRNCHGELAATCKLCKSNERVGRDGRKINAGLLTWRSAQADRRNQKRRENLARMLKGFFRIDGDPFVPCGNGWRALFRVEVDSATV